MGEQGKLEGVAQSVQEHLGSLNEGLARRLAISAARSLLELMHDTAHALSKVEKLLIEAEGSKASHGQGAGALEAQCQLLERLAGEVARLHYNTARGQDLPFVQALTPRIENADAQLGSLLAEGLTASLQQDLPSARRHCLAAFAAVGDTASAEQVVRRTLVAPAVQAALTSAAAARPPGAAPGSEGLQAVLPPMLSSLLDRCRGVLEATLGSRSGLAAFNFPGNSILAEIDEALANAMPGVFSPGVPVTFHANFQAAMAFLDSLESNCSHAAALTALRSCPAHASFLKRWKLSVYFSLRFQDIAGDLEAALSAASLEAVPAEAAASNTMALQLLPGFRLQQCLNRAIAPDVFLRPLSDKTVRLALQLVARLTSWLGDGLSARAAAPAQPTHAQTSHPAGSPDSATPSEDASGRGPHHWAVEASPDELARLRADIDEVAEWVQVDFAQALAAVLDSAPSQVIQAVRTAVADGSAALEAQGIPLAGAIVTHLAARCCDALRQLKAIPTTYRMTSKPMPFRPSPYAGALLHPLTAFLNAPASQAMRRAARSHIAQEVVAGVAAKFGAMAGELLDQLQRTETSLRRLKKARAPESGGAEPAAPSQLSDVDKMALQLFLDVQELGRQSEKVGVDPRKLPSFQSLWKAVAPADKADIAW